MLFSAKETPRGSTTWRACRGRIVRARVCVRVVRPVHHGIGEPGHGHGARDQRVSMVVDNVARSKALADAFGGRR